MSNSRPKNSMTAKSPTTMPACTGGDLECVVLPVRSGHEPSRRDPVRIFLGTGPAHARAERIFVWSIERVRDPARVYEIHLMRGITGFSRSGLGAESLNFRFAVPELAGARGRALYNEIGQIYLRDPAELFDADLDGWALLARSDALPSPILFDCERMAEVWSVRDATNHPEAQLLEAIESRGHLRGALEAAWWCVDEDHFDAESTRLLHFHRLHTQPWRPFLDDCIYHKSTCEPVWNELEHAADKAGFELFDARAPSLAFERLVAEAQSAPAAATTPTTPAAENRRGFDAPATRELADLLRRAGVRSLVECEWLADPRDAGPDAPSEGDFPTLERFRSSLLGLVASPDSMPTQVDAIWCRRVLEAVPEQDLPWVMREIFATARRVVHADIVCDSNDRGCVERWRACFEKASRHFPDIHWSLRVERRSPDGRGVAVERLHGGCWLGGEAPRVWVLVDDRPGNATQSLGLADALGWPYEIKKLRHGPLAVLHNRFSKASLLGVDRRRSDPLEAPWPDLVIATGRRTAPVAQWLRAQSGGRARVVAMGRKAGDDAELFDLSVTPEYCRCMPHPRRFETGAPLHRMTREALRVAEKEWAEELQTASPRPRIALLVGGTSGQFWLDAAVARKMGRDVAELVASSQGSLWVSTSRRTGDAATQALEAAISEIAPADHFHRWTPDADTNPYRGYLACADAFVMTADSESMLAEACFTGKPVYIYPMPERKSFRVLGVFRDLVLRISSWEGPSGRSRAPQRALAYFCSWLISKGFVRPTRDLNLFHDSLVERGVARRFGTALEASGAPPLCEVEEVADRVRSIMGA